MPLPAPEHADNDALLDQLHVRIFTSRRLMIDAAWNSADVYSTFWRLYVNNRSGAGVQWAGGLFPLTGGRVHLVPAWVRFTCVNRREIEHCYLHFDLVGLPAALVRELFARPVTLASDPVVEVLRDQWIDHLRLPRGEPMAALCAAKALAYASIGRLASRLTPQQRLRCTRHFSGRGEIAPALEYIDSHLDEDLGNDRLAALCGVSTDHFIRLFRRYVGQTPTQYTLDRRVGRAAERLVFSTDSIEKIAEETGFSDRFYFSRVFARRMGQSPAAYRRAPRV
jgi:AraC-like DNA-binding protein